MTRWTVTFKQGSRSAKVVIEAETIVQAIYEVCSVEEIPHRAILEAKKVR